MVSKFKSLLIVGGSLLLIAGLFQNCSGNGLEAGVSNSIDKLYGNGGGYTGKTIYAHRSENSSCADGVDAIIEVTSEKKAYLTREGCQDQAPQEIQLSSLQLMSHNKANIVYKDSVFDEESQSETGVTSLLCRGTSFDEDSQTTRVVDALIKKNVEAGTEQYSGRVVLGIYGSNEELIKTYDLGEVAVREPYVLSDFEYYTSISISAGLDQRFALTLRQSTMEGSLQYNGNIPANMSGVPDPEHSENFIVRGLECYRQ